MHQKKESKVCLCVSGGHVDLCCIPRTCGAALKQSCSAPPVGFYHGSRLRCSPSFAPLHPTAFCYYRCCRAANILARRVRGGDQPQFLQARTTLKLFCFPCICIGVNSSIKDGRHLQHLRGSLQKRRGNGRTFERTSAFTPNNNQTTTQTSRVPSRGDTNRPPHPHPRVQPIRLGQVWGECPSISVSSSTSTEGRSMYSTPIDRGWQGFADICSGWGYRPRVYIPSQQPCPSLHRLLCGPRRLLCARSSQR